MTLVEGGTRLAGKWNRLSSDGNGDEAPKLRFRRRRLGWCKMLRPSRPLCETGIPPGYRTAVNRRRRTALSLQQLLIHRSPR